MRLIDPHLPVFTAALLVQRPPKDQQRYRDQDAEPHGQWDRSKLDEYPCDERGEDYRDGCNPSA
jgi:hypothetical protein